MRWHLWTSVINEISISFLQSAIFCFDVNFEKVTHLEYFGRLMQILELDNDCLKFYHNFLFEYSLMVIVKPKYTRSNEIRCRVLEIEYLSKNLRKTQHRTSLTIHHRNFKWEAYMIYNEWSNILFCDFLFSFQKKINIWWSFQCVISYIKGNAGFKN